MTHVDVGQVVAEAGIPDRVAGFVAGRWLPGVEGGLDIEDPATGKPFYTAGDGAPQVDAAVMSALAAFESTWSTRSGVERGRTLQRCADAVRSNADLLARLECVDTGKPLSQAVSDVAAAARFFEYYAGVADKLHGATIPSEDGSLAYTRREPFGVDAHVTPSNSPLSQLARGAAASLVVGNTVVAKPSELTPLSTLAVARILADAGLPDGVFNVVLGTGPDVGAALVGHSAVSHLTFTGSVPTGRVVLAAAARRILPCNLELGGKSPTIVAGDADLAAAVAAGTDAVVRNAGQSSSATTRMIVHESIYYEFVERCATRMVKLQVGPGLCDPDLGPLVSAPHRDRVGGLVEAARRAGAEVVCGGADEYVDVPQRYRGGHYFAPTLLADVENGMDIAREEVFGPVQCVLPYADEDEAVAIANSSEYGLAAGVFTKDLATGHRLAHRLQAGQVLLNRYPAGGVELPYGGYKASGIGREKGLEALRHYTQLKTVVVDLGSETGP